MSDAVSGSFMGFGGPTILGSNVQRQWNRADAQTAQNWSAQAAADQMEFQRMMSGTAHRREVADLKAAGLNPMLSAMHTGASTPPGAGFAGQKAASPSAVGGTGSTSWQRQTAAQTTLTLAQADREVAEAENLRGIKRDVGKATVENLKTQVMEAAIRMEKLWAETDNQTASAANIRQQTENLKAELPRIKALIVQIKQSNAANMPEVQRQIANLDRLFKEMERPGRQTTESFRDTRGGAVIQAIGEALKALNPLLPSTSHNERR